MYTICYLFIYVLFFGLIKKRKGKYPNNEGATSKISSFRYILILEKYYYFIIIVAPIVLSVLYNIKGDRPATKKYNRFCWALLLRAYNLKIYYEIEDPAAPSFKIC